MAPTFREWALGVAVAAVVIPVVTLLAVWCAKRIGRWLGQAIAHSFGQVVLDVMAPDMAHLGTKVSSSMDELRITNTADHAITAVRLTAVEARQTDVELRLAAVEAKINIRPAEARTRREDPT